MLATPATPAAPEPAKAADINFGQDAFPESTSSKQTLTTGADELFTIQSIFTRKNIMFSQLLIRQQYTGCRQQIYLLTKSNILIY